MRFGGLSYRTEGLCRDRKNVVFSEISSALGMVINTLKGSFSKRCKSSGCENSPFAKRVQCNESLLKG